MAFVLTVEADSFLIQAVDKSDEAVATLDIGYDDEQMLTFKALVALVPVPGHSSSARELIFEILETDTKSVTNDYKSGLSTKGFLIGDDRHLVLEAICNLARHMVVRFDVELLVINTVETHLPPKAMRKYSKICEAISEAGYSAGKVDAYHGQEQWQIVKI